MVAEALDICPGTRPAVQNVALSSSKDCAARLLRLYQGLPLTRRTSQNAAFRGSLDHLLPGDLFDLPHRADVVNQVRPSVIHEVVHYFGIVDDRSANSAGKTRPVLA